MRIIRTMGVVALTASMWQAPTLGGAANGPSDMASAARAQALPEHFGIGLSAQPDDTGIYGWLPDSGVPWDFAYQYLAAGVNTGNGWQTWNEDAQFPLWYAQGASDAGYIPVFPYYMLLHSIGPCDGCEEARQDLAHLNSPRLMRQYFADFVKLMQRLGPGTYGGIEGFGGTAIVHVEPDLSGYAQHAVLSRPRCFGFCTARGNDPANLRASVRRSGHPDVGEFENTFRGFSLALAHLRDLYAPNVLLAFHVSNWATLQDVGSSQDPNLDVAHLGRMAGRFAAMSGAWADGGYDLVFNDVADRDAGYYKEVVGRDVWWDRLNVEVPHFHRWERYVRRVTRETSLPLMVWQIPLGTQYHRTSNNTWGHYQDNRSEYFMAHVDELMDVGVVGLLFGSGNAGSTVNWDGESDGVTNPTPFCTSDGMSSGTVCNTHESTVTDDDGGFIRDAGAAYFENPVPL